MTRRDLVLGVVGTVLGSLGLVAGVGEGERLDARARHLRDVESDTVYASAVRVDRGRGLVRWHRGKTPRPHLR